MDKNRKLLLEEKAELPRQIENLPTPRTWVYFNWTQKEKISAKGILDDSLERMNQKARYISFNGKKWRMPLLVSGNGYGIGIAAELIALLHDIGRFEQIRCFDSFEPGTMDHAAYGVKVLFEEGMIRNFIKEDRFDDIIKIAILKHSDYELSGIEDERMLLHAKLIRNTDAGMTSSKLSIPPIRTKRYRSSKKRCRKI